MSGQGNQQYLMKIVFDDSQIKDVENRLKNAFGVGVKSGGSGSGSGDSPMKNLLKLGGIATGVVGLVAIGKKILDLTISSSPMLKGMLQLFGNTVMFILRPIGDFIGYMLKPIIIYLLRYVAIPFYKYWAPFMQKWGTKIGEFIVAALKYLNTKSPVGNGANGDGKGITWLGPFPLTDSEAKIINDGIKSFSDLFDPTSPKYLFKPLLSVNLTSLWNTAITPVTDFFNTLKTNTLSALWTKAIVPISDFITSLKFSFGTTLQTIWNNTTTPISDFFLSLKNTFGTTLEKILNTIITPISDFFLSLKNTFGTTLQNIWDNVVDKINAFFQAIIDFVKDPIGTIKKATAPKPVPHQVVGSNQIQIGTPTININIDTLVSDVKQAPAWLQQAVADAWQKLQNMGAHP